MSDPELDRLLQLRQEALARPASARNGAKADFGVWLRRLLGGKKGPDVGPFVPPVRLPPCKLDSIAEGNNDFAVAMYGELQGPGNLLFSPFSIRAALGMTQAGAKGETAAQMSAALHTSSSDETLHAALASVVQRLSAAGGRTYELAVANSLWCQDGAPLLATFLDLMARYYGAGVNLVDFRGGADKARRTINRWVEDNTRRRIQKLIPSGSLGADARLVLVNAVYFKGMWRLPFSKAATRQAPFHLEGGGTAQAPLMHQRTELRYRRAAGYQAVDLAYQGGSLSMLVLLPDRKDGLRDLEKTVSARMLDECALEMGDREVDLFLPRFRITWGTIDLRDRLIALGMPLPFNPSQADFSGINGHHPPHAEAFFISAVFHKAFAAVNEEGTEATAATAVSCLARLEPSDAPVPVVRADHPFLFAIRDQQSGAILFLGRMADPTRES